MSRDAQTRAGGSAGSRIGVRARKTWWPGGAAKQAGRPEPAAGARLTLDRIGGALDLLDIRHLADGQGSLLAMWERHAVLFTVEGPDDEILVVRARPHTMVPPERAGRAYERVNQWNHTRRFCKAYVGDPLDSGHLPIYAELQVSLAAGVHEALLAELLACGAAATTSFVDWLHDEGGLW
jgi:hypothetical protein